MGFTGITTQLASLGAIAAAFLLLRVQPSMASSAPVIQGVTFKVLHAKAVANASISRILGSYSNLTEKACMLKCQALLTCWGTEYAKDLNTCRLILGFGHSDVNNINMEQKPHSRIAWIIRTGYCLQPKDYGQYARTTWDGLPQGLGITIQLKCAKGSAFNTAQLAAMGYNTTIQQKFGPLTLTCSKDGQWRPLPSDTPQCQDIMECRRTPMGKEYMGTMNVTRTGIPCINWLDQNWNGSSILKDETAFPNGSMADQKNYCRNPVRSEKPWCFVANSLVKWALCDIPMCQDTQIEPLECKLTPLGKEYTGTQSVNSDGKSCILWDNGGVLDKDYQFHLSDSGVDANTKSCRNPRRWDGGQGGGPWCWHNMVGGWAECKAVPFCPGFP